MPFDNDWKDRESRFDFVVISILVSEFGIVFLFLAGCIVKLKQTGGWKMRKIMLLIYLGMTTCLLRILLMLDFWLYYSQMISDILLFLAPTPLFSCGCVLVLMWVELFLVMSCNYEIPFKLFVYSKCKIMLIFVNILAYGSIIIFAILGYTMSGFNFGTSMRLLHASISLFLLSGFIISGVILAGRVKQMTLERPYKLIKWIGVAVLACSFRCASYGVMAVDGSMWGLLNTTYGWGISVLIDFNLVEICPILVFLKAWRIAEYYSSATSSEIDMDNDLSSLKRFVSGEFSDFSNTIDVKEY
ncbi:unnamed protein product [Blepharisma stoltei]|uniref:THH1/TOM1/TOM3 domain-containing protein n=1 Tax=Blepharisma stoltei TaxID=1481888 RepID=A0AAU9IPV1_9CILI|nr:unnamed protein product [Blepharisma stoltei]